eukprot:m.363013 g.363013  ORF g.363013 m.363013 type:complete len:68 (-) comp21316_c0_seq1:593-796(-)
MEQGEAGKADDLATCTKSMQQSAETIMDVAAQELQRLKTEYDVLFATYQELLDEEQILLRKYYNKKH